MKKLFLFNQTDFILAENKESAKTFYQGLTGETDDEMLGNEIEEILRKRWRKMIIVDDEYKIPVSKKVKRTIFTFEEYMKEFEEKDMPCVFASSEC